MTKCDCNDKGWRNDGSGWYPCTCDKADILAEEEELEEQSRED